MRGVRVVLSLLLVCLVTTACKRPPDSGGKKILRYPLRAKIGSLDPVAGSSQYQNMPIAAIFDTLLGFRYPVRPFELEPVLLTKMPEVSEDGRTYRFELRDDVLFQDDECFPGGQGRAIVSSDVVYSLMRSADDRWSPAGYWLFQGRIEGLDEHRTEQRRLRSEAAAAGRPDDYRFDYETLPAGFRVLDDRRFEIVLTQPFPQFLYILTMGYSSIVPREAVEHYGLEFGQNPVGSGPFQVKEFFRGSWLKLEKNPDYRDDHLPTELHEDQLAAGLGPYAGAKLPLLDEIHLPIYENDQPMWLKFRAGDLDASQVPAEYKPTVCKRNSMDLLPDVAAEGLQSFPLPLLDLIYWGFNMEDPTWGQPPEMKLVRQAISYAVDLEQRNIAFYNNDNTLYIGPIPPGLSGYEPGYRKQDLDKARALMTEAGFPDGEGLPILQYQTSKSTNAAEQAEMFTRQVSEIGIRVNTSQNSFPELSDKLNRKKAQFFGLAWGADYPDAENFLQLFYGPNEAPGSNNFNYKNPEYDRIFDQAKVMDPADPERTRLYQQLRDILIEDQPMIGSMARTRLYVWHPRLKNFKPEEVYYTWWKYLDVADDDDAPSPMVASAGGVSR